MDFGERSISDGCGGRWRRKRLGESVTGVCVKWGYLKRWRGVGDDGGEKGVLVVRSDVDVKVTKLGRG